MNKILLLSNRHDFSERVNRILVAKNYKVVVEADADKALDLISNKPYDLLIMDQNFSLSDKTPLILFLLQKTKTSIEPYPPIILAVPDNFRHHEHYPEVDDYIFETTSDNEIALKVSTCLEAMKYLSIETQQYYESSFDEIREVLERELSKRDRQLTSNTILLMKKNDQLYYVYDFLNKMEKNPTEEGFDRLKKQILQFLNEDELTESFFSYFNITHPEFLKTLDKSASLSLTEKKHCACLKMGLDNKQIASLFSIDTGSVKKGQTRLKNKLKVTGTQSLRAFISKL